MRRVRFLVLRLLPSLSRVWGNVGKGGKSMKLMNYDTKSLIYQNLRSDVREVKEKPQTFTKRQYDILCRLIKQTKQFFYFLLESLFELKDWKQLNYEQMYELVHVLTFWNYQTETEKERIKV